MKSKIDVEVLWFAGCPNSEAVIKAARSLRDIDWITVTEVDLLDENLDAKYKGYGSPTVLVQGQDIYGVEPGQGIGCRIYNEGTLPNRDLIIQIAEQKKAAQQGD